MLESLLTDYGYPALIIGTFLEGETVMMLAGVAAHMGHNHRHSQPDLDYTYLPAV